MFNKQLKQDLENTAEQLQRLHDGLDQIERTVGTSKPKTTWTGLFADEILWGKSVLTRLDRLETSLDHLRASINRLDSETDNAYDSWSIEKVSIGWAGEPECAWQWLLLGPTKRLGPTKTDEDASEWRPTIEWGREKTYAKARREMLLAMVALNEGVPNTEPSKYEAQ